MPATWLLLPVSSMARVGAHIGDVWKFVNRMPSAARRSMLGVRMSLPYAPVSV
jgi:hypothetical protein